MKKMKFAVICAAVTAMMGFTSCLDGDTNNVSTGIEFVQNSYRGMVGRYEFKNSAGYTLIPGNQKDWAETSISNPYVAIYYQFSPDSLKQNTLPITLQGMVGVKEAVSSMQGVGGGNVSDENTWANAPLYQASVEIFPYFDKDNLFLSVQYYAKTNDEGSVTEDEKNEYAHQFMLYNAETEDESISGNNLVLYLLHKVADTNVNSERTSSSGFNYVHFNIANAISWYKSRKSDIPENIVIKYMVPGIASGDDMLNYEKAKEVTNPIRLPYSQYFKQAD